MRFCKSFLMFFFLSCYTGVSYAMLDALIVSAARTEQSALTTPASITVISRNQIENSGARHIVDVLQGRGGIQIIDSFGDGSRSSVGMRGFGESANANTLVLIDGRRLNNLDISSPDLNSIALEDVERIEILQGSAGVLFGDQAVGGVINIITRKPGALRYSLELYAGSYEATGFHGMASQAMDDGFNYNVSLDLRESDNYRRHNEVSYLNGFGRLGYENEIVSIFAELQYIDDELNTPGTLFSDEIAEDRRQVNANFANDFSVSETTVGRMGVTRKINDQWSFEGEITSRKTDGIFRLSSVFGAELQDSTQDRGVVEFTPRFIATLPGFNNTLLTLGADLIKSDYHLNSRFGEQFNNQTQNSIYAQVMMHITEVLDLTLGVRNASVENVLRDSGAFALYPTGIQIDDDVMVGTFGLSVKLNNDWDVSVRADQNYRFAKVDEYLQPAFTPTFVPIVLKTQEGISLEAIIDWRQNNQSAKLVIFTLKLDDEIAFDPINFSNINLNETRRNGVLTEFHFQLNKKIMLGISHTFTDAEVVNGAFKGKAIPLVSEHSGVVSSNYRLNAQWGFYGEVQAQGSRVFSGDFNNTLSRLPGYGVANVKAKYEINNFVFSARVNNILNREYTKVGVLGMDPVTFLSKEAYFSSPKRYFLLTAAWKFR